MNLSSISKAIAGAAAGGVGTVAAMAGAYYIVIPEGVTAPWWGYMIAGVANAALSFAIVYFAPRNTQ